MTATVALVGEMATTSESGTESEPFEPVVPSERDHPVAQVIFPCVEWTLHRVPIELPGLGILFIPVPPPTCTKPLTCGAERVDDLYFGRISGQNGLTGNYGEYLTRFIDGTLAAPSVVDIDVDLTNQSFLNSIGEQPDNLAIAIFYFCRHDNGDFEVTDTNWSPSFGWDTNVLAEYDIPGIHDDLFEQIERRVGLYKPALATTPAQQVGHTYVNFPTWFWVDEPLTDVARHADNDIATVRAEITATLERVDFHLGDTTLTCTLEQMTPYVPGESDPIDDLPECHEVFTQAADVELATTLTYRVEQRVQQRRHDTHPWPNPPFEAHPRSPITLTTEAGSYGVHELLALNVNRELELAGN